MDTIYNVSTFPGRGKMHAGSDGGPHLSQVTTLYRHPDSAFWVDTEYTNQGKLTNPHSTSGVNRQPKGGLGWSLKREFSRDFGAKRANRPG